MIKLYRVKFFLETIIESKLIMFTVRCFWTTKLVRTLCSHSKVHCNLAGLASPLKISRLNHSPHRYHGSAAPDNYIIRNVTSASEVRSNHVKGAIIEGWRPAIDDHEVYFATDPTGFFVGEVDGKIVCCKSIVKYGEDVAFGGYYIVEKPYRGKGYGLAMYDYTFDRNRNLGIDGVLENIPLYEKWGFKSTWINRRMLFDVSHCATHLDTFNPSAGVLVQPAKQVDLDLLSAYDTAAFGAPHDLYLKALLKAQNAINLAATNSSGDIIGFVSVRRTILEEDGWKIGPLFADDSQIARTLLKHLYKELAKEVSKRKVATMDIPADINPESMALAEELKATFLSDLSRMFTKGPLDIPKKKIFGFTSAELG